MRRWYKNFLLLACLASCSRREAEKPPSTNEYVDAAICADCHTDKADTYSNTGMARSFYSPDAASIPNPEPYFHRASNTWYQIVARNGGWYQRSWQIGFKGQEESVTARNIRTGKPASI